MFGKTMKNVKEPDATTNGDRQRKQSDPLVLPFKLRRQTQVDTGKKVPWHSGEVRKHILAY